MSYGIFYDKQFVKVGFNKMIPMILAGDNNCWTCDPHPKRTRDWQVFSYLLKSNMFETPEKIISAIDSDIEKTLENKSGPDKYDDGRMITKEEVAEQYGYYTSLAIRGSTHSLTAKKYRSFVVTGVKNAMSIDELHKMGINVEFYNYHYQKDTLSIPVPVSTTIKKQSDFWTELEKWNIWAGKCKLIDHKDRTETPAEFSIQFDTIEELTTARLKSFRSDRRRANAKPTSDVEVDHYFTLKNAMGYLIRYTRFGYKYSYHAGYSNKKYQTEKDAERYIKTLEKNGKTDDWEIEQINRPTTFKVSGGGVRGIKKLTPYQAWDQAWAERT